MRDTEHYLFYCADVSGSNNVIRLDPGESAHAVSVLRVKAGRRLHITNGNGTIYDCECVDIAKGAVSCRIVGSVAVPRIAPDLTLLLGLPDKDRFETVVEYAAALGVSRVVPLVMDHCRNPWWERWDRLRERFAAKMVASMKQCLYPYIPRLDAPARLGDVVDGCGGVLVADQDGTVLSDADLSALVGVENKITCLVGPPGGISADEFKFLEPRGSTVIKLAGTRLRTELAAVVLCSRVLGACSWANAAML